MSDYSFNPQPWGPHGARQERPGPPVHPADAQIPLRPVEFPTDLPQPQRPADSVPFGDPHGMPVGMVPSFLKDVLAGSFFINVVFVAILWQVWVCLYPLSALAGGVTFAKQYGTSWVGLKSLDPVKFLESIGRQIAENTIRALPAIETALRHNFLS